MGKVFRPADITRGRKRIVEEAVRDLSPGIREATVRILESRVGNESEERLVRLLGEEEAKRLIKRIKGI
ncbi:MAG: hypothetical protein V1850_02350 [Candidatus Bathyarchaeota archaeon]